ncbi:AAA family ATPase [Skermanella sp. TT6]|uniref:AAA family ATPase n=1 Tax=Skermanella cutis TaxID=2775420 RepID=A0ABX7AZV6_9PROT|nr:DEAD/DEAH box helicase [Skermanella sp. TT6]QQP87531.1 AAA family ATPase [Skermanella sp. TT6]
MTSSFGFLQTRWPELHKRAVQAEFALHVDADVTAIRLRCFGELLISAFFQLKSLPELTNGRQIDRLRFLEDNRLLNERLLGKLHTLRLLGNKAAHGGTVSAAQAAGLLADAWALAQWFCRLIAPEELYASGPFRLPDPGARPAGASRETVEEALAETGGGREEASDPAAKPARLSQDDSRQEREASDKAFNAVDPTTRELRTPISLREAFAGATLSKSQEEAVEELERFFAAPQAEVFLLKGHAGTGKTFIIRGLADYLSAQGRMFRLCAPTGRAARVIEGKTGYQAGTLHRTIYNFKELIEYTDEGLKGSETFKNYAQIATNDDAANAVYMVDEASLISDAYQESEFFRSGSGYLLKDFFNFVRLDHNDHDKKIILIGDTAQLPPVDMSFSPALDADYLHKTYGVSCRSYELEDVVRQKADSGVLRNVMPLRDSLKSGKFCKLTFDFSVPDIEKVEGDRVLSRYLEACNHAINDKAIIVARSNAEAAGYNRMIREHFFPGKSEIVPGDKLMVVANITVSGLFIANGDFILAKEVDERVETRRISIRRKNPDTKAVETVEVTISFRGALLGVRDTDGRAQFIQTKILENVLYDSNPNIGSDEQKALYIDFCMRHEHLRKDRNHFQEVLRADPYFNALRVKFGYAVTCHKAQGGEWEHVFVVCPRGQNELSSDYFRWLYTAMTRAKGRLYMVKPPHREVGADIKVIGMPPFATSCSSAETISVSPEDSIGSPDAPPERFGLTEQNGVLFAILGHVQAALEGTNIEIEDIVHNQYQEAYFFRRDGESARVNIAYNGKGKIGRIMPTQVNALSGELNQCLGALSDRILTPANRASSSNDVIYVPSQEFLGTFHEWLLSRAKERGIQIADVAELPWCQRYTFARGSDAVVVDIYYNGRGTFSTCKPVNPSRAPRALLSEVIDLLPVRKG